MSLISIKEYSGSEVAKAVIEALETVGVVNKLNINGYHLTIDGIQGKTPKGMIDDTPSIHIIKIERNKFIRNCTAKEFEAFKKTDEYASIIEEQNIFSLDFEDTTDKEVTHEISVDTNNYMWYKHKVEFTIEKSILETLEGYVKRIFEEIAQYIIDTFESME